MSKVTAPLWCSRRLRAAPCGLRAPPARCVSAQPDSRAEAGTWERARSAGRGCQHPRRRKRSRGRRQQQGRTDCHRPTAQRSSTDQGNNAERSGSSTPGYTRRSGHTRTQCAQPRSFQQPSPGNSASAHQRGNREGRRAAGARLSRGKERASAAATRQDLENTVLSAVRQRKTDTVRPHYVRNLTNNADEHACKLEADVQTQKTQLSLAKGRGGEGKIGAWD